MQTMKYFWQCLLSTDHCVAIRLSGHPVKSNYVQIRTCKTLKGQFFPHATLPCFLGFHLFLVKNTDGKLELMCSGLNGPWTLSPPATLLPKRKRDGKKTPHFFLPKLCKLFSLSLDVKESMTHFLHLPRFSSVKFALSEGFSQHGFYF